MSRQSNLIWIYLQLVHRVTMVLKSHYSRHWQNTSNLITQLGNHNLIQASKEYLKKWLMVCQILGGVNFILLNGGGSNLILPTAMIRIKLVSWLVELSLVIHNSLGSTTFSAPQARLFVSCHSSLFSFHTWALDCSDECDFHKPLFSHCLCDYLSWTRASCVLFGDTNTC